MVESIYEIRDRLNNLRDRLKARVAEDALIVLLSYKDIKDLLEFMDKYLDD